MRLRFGEFVFDGGRRQLLRRDEPVAIAPKPFALLELLLERRPDAVSKEEILERLWGPIAITEGVLTTAIGELRHALMETAQAPRFLRTVHRFGYAFVGEAIELAREIAMARAVLVGDDRRIELFDGENVLGRHGGKNGDILDPSVSRHHARVTVLPEGKEVEDLGSKNGTWVNGVRVVGKEPIADGEELRLGTVVFVLRDLSVDAETETRTAFGSMDGSDSVD